MCSTADLSFVDFGLTYELADIVLSHLVAAPQRLRSASKKTSGKGGRDLKATEVSHSSAYLKILKAPPLHTLVEDDSRWATMMRQVHVSIKPKV